MSFVQQVEDPFMRPETPMAIVFDRVTFAYTQGYEVFRDVSFQIPKGGFYFVTGPSGAGKSSLLKLVYRANTNYLGSIRVMGHEMKSVSEDQLPLMRQRIGLMFQEFHLLEHLSTLDNVALPLVLAGEETPRAREKAAELLSWLGLGSFLQQTPMLLSGGQRQRIALARSVIHDPDIVLADEPTGHVDDKNAMKLMSLFEILYQKGKTILLATHNRSIVDAMGYPELALDQGALTMKQPQYTASPYGERYHG